MKSKYLPAIVIIFILIVGVALVIKFLAKGAFQRQQDKGSGKKEVFEKEYEYKITDPQTKRSAEELAREIVKKLSPTSTTKTKDKKKTGLEKLKEILEKLRLKSIGHLEFGVELFLLLSGNPDLAYEVAKLFAREKDKDTLFQIAKNLGGFLDEKTMDFMLNQLMNGDELHRMMAVFSFLGNTAPEIISVMINTFLKDESELVKAKAALYLQEATGNISYKQKEIIKQAAKEYVYTATAQDLRVQSIDLIASADMTLEDYYFIEHVAETEQDPILRIHALKAIVDYNRKEGVKSEEEIEEIERIIKELSEKYLQN
jgi:hypothetical protein